MRSMLSTSAILIIAAAIFAIGGFVLLCFIVYGDGSDGDDADDEDYVSSSVESRKPPR
ncbi:hypothetical protein [Aestuariivirga sp.]|uniref:hypothetical protein n=1 Tax=Aestuariivirga sp. TaxID=2650926 RepID=UPI0039E70CC1